MPSLSRSLPRTSLPSIRISRDSHAMSTILKPLRSIATLILGAAVAAFCWPASAQADDMGFGADTLGYLSKEARAVVRVTEPRAMTDSFSESASINYVRYVVRVVERYVGDAVVAGRDIQIAFIRSQDIRDKGSLTDSIVFLKRIPKEDIEQSNIQGADGVHLVVSGRYGAIAVGAGHPERLESIRSYVSIGPSRGPRQQDGLFGWIEKYGRSKDPLLQRSAVVDLYFLRSDPRSVAQLGNMLKADVRSPEKSIAIMALGYSGLQSAADPLRNLAENPLEPEHFRTQAVRAYKSLPDGGVQLQFWKQSTDGILSNAAEGALKQ
jgi:hypothetical protein